MVQFILKRVSMIIPVYLFAIFITFGMIHLSSVDPAEAYFSAAHIHATDDMLAEKRHELGLDQPFIVQYAKGVVDTLTLNLGKSYVSNQPVWNEISLRLVPTLLLSIISLILAVVISVPLGFLAGIKKGSGIDHLSRFLSFVGASIPSFWLGYLFIYFFAVKLNLLPVGGMEDWTNYILPALTLAFPLIAIYTRLLRVNVMEQLKEPYVQFARTRGLKPAAIYGKHLLRNSISPMIAGLGMNLGHLLTGAIIVEVVFSWPGFGRYFIDAIFNRDVPVIRAYIIIAAVVYLLSNLLVDIIQMFINPRIYRKGSQFR
ncbi:ABC transporter permease subunit [Macrococcus hajekii]|uniref:ABC transporter permease subunit n=1 Tax=Macrococcus hajekii TaxID=198482 RepID=A0A4R6BJL9_9STAP|nr:ABC transporter permease subunit [Macrococcus hajekii]TDM01786.1 ABC transporter permease subunit [Macrococcus hajekii]GGB07467.1 nickel ABC transporter permease subunit NikB [Macrococcus hajekii]